MLRLFRRSASTVTEGGVRNTVTSARFNSGSVLRAFADRRRALHVHVQQNVPARPQFVQQFGTQHAVTPAKHRGVLDEIARLNAFLKFRRLKK